MTTTDSKVTIHMVSSLDGYIVKKDGCVYDLTLVTPPPAYEQTADTFVTFVAGFRGRGAGPPGDE